MFRHFVYAIFVFVLFKCVVNASCGSASCPIDTYSTEITEKGMIRLDYSYEYIDQDQPMIGKNRASVGAIRGHHDEVSTLNETKRFGMDVGFSDRLSVQFLLPFVHREHQHIHHHMGSDFTDSWNFDGMGDLTMLARYAIVKGSNEQARISLIAGAVFPTGKEVALNAEGDNAEVGVLPGKGAYSAIAGVQVSRAFTGKTLNGQYASLPVFFSTTYQWNEEGIDEYRIGNTWLANAGMVYPVFAKLGVITQINSRVSREDHKGNTHEEVEKTGGTYVYVSPGLQLTLAKDLWLSTIVQIPVYQFVNSIQLTSKYNFLSSLSYRFSVL